MPDALSTVLKLDIGSSSELVNQRCQNYAQNPEYSLYVTNFTSLHILYLRLSVTFFITEKSKEKIVDMELYGMIF